MPINFELCECNLFLHSFTQSSAVHIHPATNCPCSHPEAHSLSLYCKHMVRKQRLTNIQISVNLWLNSRKHFLGSRSCAAVFVTNQYQELTPTKLFSRPTINDPPCVKLTYFTNDRNMSDSQHFILSLNRVKDQKNKSKHFDINTYMSSAEM